MFNFSDIEYTTTTTNKKIEYLNLSCGFDIETTSTYVNDDQKVAFMYIWTFGMEDDQHIYMGRTWEEFMDLVAVLQQEFNLSPERRLVVYVHNLGYEFQFMRKYFNWLDIFSIDERKPIKCLADCGIEFRDSYILSGYSLSKVADNLTQHRISKLEGDLDYDLIRHSETPLTEQELQYCINDVLVIIYYIKEQLDIYGVITSIPLTNTGRVRSYVRDNCYYTNSNHRKSSAGKFYRYRKIMDDLTLDVDVYQMCKRAFMGGFTHANANYTGKVVEDVTSIDFTSSYPAVMLTEKFPMSKGIKTKFTKKKDFDWYRKRYALLFDVKFTNIVSKIQHENYISESKCGTLENPILNNGRVFSADTLVTTITDVDMNIIENCYTWDSIQVANVYRFHRGYLPKPIIDSVVELYEKKTVLKGVKGKEVEYTMSKGMLNSIYGMSVTDVVKDEIVYNPDNHEWGVEKVDEREEIGIYNEKKMRFLYYVWGIFITAYARRNLWMGILMMGDDYIYSDTDSIKFKNYDKHKPFIEEYDKLVVRKLERMCDHYGISFGKMKPKTKEGIEKLIGIWDLDGEYSRFKTLGAKRYLVEYKDTGKMELTVAGLSKHNGIEYLKQHCGGDNTKVFEEFNDDLYIDADHTGKMTHTYIDSEHSFEIEDYMGNKGEVTTLSGVHLEGCDFTLSIAKQYAEFIENLQSGYLYTGLDFK